jgi:pSer/pThr/pTyr-binding forkhead associated (FHA) protein
VKCAFCEAMIDDDSYYCDQCGEKIKLCPQCGKPGKGKRCIFDGEPLAAAEESAENKPLPRLVDHDGSIDIELKPDTVIGRSSGEYSAAFQHFQTISGTHAKFEFKEEKWIITDLNSTNGTSIDGKKISPQMPAELSDGAVVRFADIEFTFLLPEQTAQEENPGTMRV